MKPAAFGLSSINLNSIRRDQIDVKDLRTIKNNSDLKFKSSADKENIGEEIVTNTFPADDIRLPTTHKNTDIKKASDVLAIRSAQNNSVKSDQRTGMPVFLGNLPNQIDEVQLRDAFKNYPSLSSVKICTNFRRPATPKYAYLNFNDKKDALCAIEEMNYKTLFGREIKLMPSLRNSVYRRNFGTNVFVSNLPLHNKELSTRKFYDTFRRYGPILSCKLDERKNIGFIYYESDQAARTMIQDYNNREFYGNIIICGIHFDKRVRELPEFQRRTTNLDPHVIINDELVDLGYDGKMKLSSRRAIHPGTIFVDNLPSSVSDDELLEHFSKLGPIKSVYSKQSKLKTKWAFITFKQKSCAEQAIINFNKTTFMNNEIRVNYARGKAKRTRVNSQISTLVTLKNLSAICTHEFLRGLCEQEDIQTREIQLQEPQPASPTHSAYISCLYISDAQRLVHFMNKRLVGGCYVKAFIEHCKGINLENTGENSHVSPVLNYLSDSISQFQQPESDKCKKPALIELHQLASKSIKKQKLDCSHDVSDKPPQELQRIIRKVVNHLNLETITNSDHFWQIGSYIYEVFWNKESDRLLMFLSQLKNNLKFEELLHNQVDEAAYTLGFHYKPTK